MGDLCVAGSSVDRVDNVDFLNGNGYWDTNTIVADVNGCFDGHSNDVDLEDSGVNRFSDSGEVVTSWVAEAIFAEIIPPGGIAFSSKTSILVESAPQETKRQLSSQDNHFVNIVSVDDAAVSSTTAVGAVEAKLGRKEPVSLTDEQRALIDDVMFLSLEEIVAIMDAGNDPSLVEAISQYCEYLKNTAEAGRVKEFTSDQKETVDMLLVVDGRIDRSMTDELIITTLGMESASKEEKEKIVQYIAGIRETYRNQTTQEIAHGFLS
ncbi:hypothetical protein JYU14_03695 [Simkania negevensis]|uniref:Uncharacterized protein n=1 Tax=Simkania negevensis TaxID=83561 RepID=A0ABS3AUJ1_9BACT|nr:hypothetical protein [Simkania negevensis]